MKNKLINFVLLIFFLTLQGCATQKAMLDPDADTLNLEKESIALLVVEMQKTHKPSHKPDVRVLYVGTPEAEDKSKRFNFTVDEAAFLPRKDQEPLYLFRMPLKAGSYVIKGVHGGTFKLIINGTYFMPMGSGFELKNNEVVYLGHVKGLIRKRTSDSELRAGPIIPLVDQYVTGYADGTFDIVIEDKYDEDMQLLREKFPILNSAEITKRILDPVDLEKINSAQK